MDYDYNSTIFLKPNTPSCINIARQNTFQTMLWDGNREMSWTWVKMIKSPKVLMKINIYFCEDDNISYSNITTELGC